MTDKAKRPHAHICPVCKILFQCNCAEGWKLAYEARGCCK